MKKGSNYKKRPQTTRRSPSKRPEDETKFQKRECANDPSWYTVSGQLTKDVASFSFNNPSGIQYSLDKSATGSFVDPGVMAIYMSPVPGYSEGLSSPINIAAKNIYSWVRHANSGHANYDSPDLMLMIIAMANAYSFYGWMTRLYGKLRVYSQHNRYFGANLVIADGVNADNLLSNLANFRYYINQYALKLSALSVPSTMSLFKRYMWMFSNVFLDENTGKSQMYQYSPTYFYKYDEYDGAGRLVPVPVCMAGNGGLNSGMTLGNIIAIGDELVGALIGSEDVNIMSGDILKAYGQENIWKINMIPEDYAIAPVFSEEVLMQIHNTVFVGNVPLKDTTLATGWDSFSVVQDPNIGEGCLICKPLVKGGGNITANHVLDVWKDDPTPDDIIVATRNMVVGSRWSQGFTAVTGFGTEIPMCAAVWNLNASGVLNRQMYYNTDNMADYDGEITSFHESAEVLSKLNYFNEHPFLYLVKYTQTSPYVEINAGSCIGEISNFTILNFDDIEKTHLSAILSEFAVPLLGNITK